MTYTAALSPVLNTGDADTKRREILDYFHNSWEVYERLFDVMASEQSYLERPDPLRHPLIFYLGHTATFFINKLALAKVITQRVDPRFESIFAIGVDEMSWDDLDEKHYDWPTVTEVYKYRDQVKQVVEKIIAELPLKMPITWDSPLWVILMGIEHERIHLETSSVLIRQLPLKFVKSDPNWPLCPSRGEAPANEMLEVPAGHVVLGKDRDHGLYGWDNEYGRLKAEIGTFKAARYLTSNGEFQAFMAAGGYDTQKWWTNEGWQWREFKGARHPLFWVPGQGDTWRLRCLAEEIPMPWNWPVEVNQLEAKAFCNWQAAKTGRPVRLPTEREWCRLRDVTEIPDQPDWGPVPGNINLVEFASSCPVDKHIHGGFGDVVGNVWQWTESPIAGFPGFEVHPLYDDFSTPTFDGQHNLIKGGSWISTGNEATLDARYAFRRHFYQHAGFRAIESEQEVVVRDDIYETDDLVAQYCEFHYGDRYFKAPNFPRRLAALCRQACVDREVKNALDLGCATGRSTFELAKFCAHVTGIDFSARFIKVALEMRDKGSIRYAIPEEGNLVSYHERTLAELHLEPTAEKVEFWQGDAHNLKEQFTGYDLVLAANLIDRLYDPRLFLAQIAERINPGGLLVITSPYTWLEEFTPKEKWLGGNKVNGENVMTIDGLAAALATAFEPVGEPQDVEFVIRETRRKFQHTISQMSIWRRR